jgi:uncharacterized protein
VSLALAQLRNGHAEHAVAKKGVHMLKKRICSIMCRRILAALLMAPSIAFAQQSQPQLVQSAYDQVGKTVSYDPSYQAIAFPGGDVAFDRGVCTDVIIRAYRGIGIDLQLLVNQDMRNEFGAYPRLWGLSHTDSNIDHRWVPNLMVFFARHGQVLLISNEARDYKAGDIVTWQLPDGRPHIGLISDRQENGRPLAIHNIGAGTQVEDVLFSFAITGHYRFQRAKS